MAAPLRWSVLIGLSSSRGLADTLHEYVDVNQNPAFEILTNVDTMIVFIVIGLVRIMFLPAGRMTRERGK